MLNYGTKRDKEIVEDDMGKQKKAQDKYNDDVQKSFRTHTRQISNFGFPPSILRKNKNEENKEALEQFTTINLTPRHLLKDPNDFSKVSLTELSLKFESHRGRDRTGK